MRFMPLLFLAFLAVPILEVYLLIQVGGIIGALPTIALVVLTAVLGVALLRHQGMATLARAQQSMHAGQMPAVELLEGIGLLVAGAFLLTPGFFTDTLGFLLLVPTFRRALAAWFIRRGMVQMGPGPGAGRGPGQGHGQPHVIEGEYRREDEP